MEQLVKRKLDRGSKLLGENMPQCHIFYNKFHVTCPMIETWPPRREAENEEHAHMDISGTFIPYMKIHELLDKDRVSPRTASILQ
jgi:hypothetical protein